jgi:trigger factor
MIVNIQDKKLENARVEITVEVPSERIEQEYEKTFVKIQKSAKLDGFRPGKVPMPMVKTHFTELADKEVIENIVKDCYIEAIKEKGFHPIAYPVFDFTRIVRGSNFTFKATFDVQPTVELGNYKGIAVDERQGSITELDVMEEIDGLRERHAVISKKADGLPVEKGDLAKLKVKRIDNVSPDVADAAESRDITVLAGSRDDQYEFDNHVIGMNAGEGKDITFNYPADYQYKSVAGQKHVYRISIAEIQKRDLPAVDDEFAKDLGEYESLDDMKKKIRERIEKLVSEKGRGEAKGSILQKIIENSTFDIPESMVEEEKGIILERLGQRMGYRVESVAEIAPFFGMSTEDMDAKLREEAVQRIKTTLVVTEVARKEDLKATDEQFQHAVSEMAAGSGKGVDEILKMIEEQGARTRVDAEIIYNSAIDFLYDQSKVKKLSPIALKEFLGKQ